MLARRVCLAILLSLAVSPLLADDPKTICGRPEVLDMVTDMLVRRGSAARIEPGGAGEIPTREANTVRCAVRLSTRYYNTDRYGYAPQFQSATFQYFVRTGQNGLFVTAADELN